ncbi:glycosyltransferase (plasmid) [Formicincola oecophyllae]|uniref:Glycosyltransferase n=1 Tax=Formicincola oecophyllae TaxID=2558361 RepID=A0A5B9M4J6_9PROT|nr:glycosyltransferase [Formicincola oecophyllae]QEF95972.1 glycosyltransferase [Formicincola oecophyllae]
MPPGSPAERHEENGWRTRAAELIREQFIAELSPDIVHLGSLFEGYVDDAVTSIGLFDTNFLTAVTLHDLIPIVDPKRYLSELRPRRHWLRRAQFLKRADLLLSVSEYSKREAIQWLGISPEKIAVMMAGATENFVPASSHTIEHEILRRKFNLRKKFILHVGAVDPRKNVDFIFKALSTLSSDEQNVYQVVFVGRLFDEEVSRLRLAAARLGIDTTRLVFCQFVSEDDLVTLYQMCTAVVFPSTHEGFGLPALEGMAAGAPTFVANATSLPEVVGSAEQTFDPYDPKDLGKKLSRLLRDPEYYRSLKTNGLARASELTWERSADVALDSFEKLSEERSLPLRAVHKITGPMLSIRQKPKLAFVSPLPGINSGIATYSGKLLRELACHYEIECVPLPGQIITDEWILANFVIRDTGFFKRNSDDYEEIIYSVGNNEHCFYVIDLLKKIRGAVILHDYFLSDLYNFVSSTGVLPEEDFFRVLYKTNGISALLEERSLGRNHAVTKFPCNAEIFENASGIIVHSKWAYNQAISLYGKALQEKISIIPHLKNIQESSARVSARQALKLNDDDYLVCVFGYIQARKRPEEIINAWKDSNLSKHQNAKLVFVGELEKSSFGNHIQDMCCEYGISITGYVSDAIYQNYVNAADLAIQLRKESRGETSGTILDCMASGVPVIVQGDGAFLELSLKEELTFGPNVHHKTLQSVLDAVAQAPESYKTLGEEGRKSISKFHRGEDVARQIQSFLAALPASPDGGRQVLLKALTEFTAPKSPDKDDWERTAHAINFQQPALRQRQILYDVTVLAESDAKTGIQRVVRGVLASLFASPPKGYRIEPVRMDGNRLVYARQFSTNVFGAPTWVYPDSPVEFDKDDIYLSIDWVPDRLKNIEEVLLDLRRAGGKVVICVHDLLPLELPQYFPNSMENTTEQWFQCVLRVATQIVCVSQTTAEKVNFFAHALSIKPSQPIALDYFPLAADLANSKPSKGIPSYGSQLLSKLKTSTSFLMVGTIEPRKGYRDILEAMRELWSKGGKEILIFVGKKGWMMDDLCTEIEADPEFNKKLYWLSGISDEFLDSLYQNTSALIAASEGEGFGLPLVEAAHHKCHLIARDISVFREVAGEGAFYFKGPTPSKISEELQQWVRLYKKGQAPHPRNTVTTTWKNSTEILLERIFGDDHYGFLNS